MLELSRRDAWIGGGFAVSFIFACWVLTASDSPLGHDESVYGLRGRYFASGFPEQGYWSAYRAPGVPFLLGIANRLVGQSAGMSRLAISMFGLLALVAAFAIVYRFANSRMTAALTVLVMLGFSGFFTYSTTLLIDVPGLAVSLCALAVLAWAFADDMHFRPLAVVAVPLLATAATTVRFGSPIVVGAGSIGIAAAFARRVFISPFRIATTAKFAATMVFTLVGMLAVYETTLVSRTGISPSAANAALVGPKFDAAGRWDSLQAFIDLHSPLQPVAFGVMSRPLALLVALAFVGIAVEVIRFGRVARHVELLAASSIAWVIWAGIMNYSLPLMVPQYLMLGSFFFAAAVAVGLDLLRLNILEVPFVRANAFTLGAGVFVVLMLPPIISSYSSAQRQHDGLESRYAVIREGSIRAGAALGEDCILLTGAAPQVGYYSRCAVSKIGTNAQTGERQEVIADALAQLNILLASSDVDSVNRVGYVFLNRGKRQLSDGAAAGIDDIVIPNIVELGSDTDGLRQRFWVDELVFCAPAQLECADE